ncbi:MAG: pyridoxamine 5'-phosphate oxidase family protein [Bacteroidaceae bacterium]|nr:pyridoxamine 5'-phosphate oxidase family protein [Bacteroidaceae bacterium]
MKRILLILAMSLTVFTVSYAQKTDGRTSATPKANAVEVMTPQELVTMLKECDHYFLATVNDNLPCVRPVTFIDIYNGEVYSMTRKSKDVYEHIKKNPNIQIAFYPKDSRNWARVSCKLVEAETPEVRRHFLAIYPSVIKAHPDALTDTDLTFMRLTGISVEIGKKVYQVK